jgi:hypothetical protein
MIRWMCEEPGPHHEYDVSTFFYESQGERAPKKCAVHMDEDASGSDVASVGGRLFSKMKRPGEGTSVLGKMW